MTDTNTLLKDFVENRSDAAFREIVDRYINLVYSVASRRLEGDLHKAQDVVQQVFIDLAKKARSLRKETTLGGWLHRHTCFVTSTVLRGDRRRHLRELLAAEMNTVNDNDDTTWNSIETKLDEAVNKLVETDRNTIVLRFFENHSLKELGVTFGISEGAAQKRLARTLEKLRYLLPQKGGILSVSALMSLLSTRAVVAAPVGLSSKISNAALAAVGGLTSFFLNLLNLSKLKMGVGMVAIAAAIFSVAKWQGGSVEGGNNEVALANPISMENANLENKDSNSARQESEPLSDGVNADDSAGEFLELTIVAAESGKPIPGVQVDYRGWEGRKFKSHKYYTNPLGICEIPVPFETTTHLQLTTRQVAFSDTRLSWRPDRGEIIPFNYTLRLTRSAAIGGMVVDADGFPVVGAKVGFNHEDDLRSGKGPESYDFSWIEVKTNEEGRWEIDRIAREVIPRLYGSARHPDHVNSSFIYVSRQREVEQKLLAKSFVFRMKSALSIHGVVVDSKGSPIPRAKILVGQRSSSGRRKATAIFNGTFTVLGCKPGKNLLTAEAEGYAPNTIEINIQEYSEPFQITLENGKSLYLRVVNRAGDPVPNANVWLNMIGRYPTKSSQQNVPPIQFGFAPKTDTEGRVEWHEAPDRELTFDIHARGYMRVNEFSARPNGQEHVVILPSALVIFGTVEDSETNEPIPNFRIITGWSSGGRDLQPRWSTLDRFWLKFSGGKFRHSFEEAVINGIPDPGYIFKFEAEGYATYISPIISAEDGEVRIDVEMVHASEIKVQVHLPDGSPATQTDVGLFSTGSRIEIIPGGISRDNVGSLLITDNRGRFSLPPDNSIKSVVIAHPKGFQIVDVSVLVDNASIRLEPWGRLEVEYQFEMLDGLEMEFTLGPIGKYPLEISFDFSTFKSHPDGQGRFVFPKAPPGRYQLIRLDSFYDTGNERKTWTHVPLAEVEIFPGETSKLTIENGSAKLD